MNAYELFERIFCTTLLFVTVYYTMKMPALGEVIRYNAEKQQNRQKYNDTMLELLALRPIQQEFLYDKISDYTPISKHIFIDGHNQVILLSHLNVTNVMRLFKEALHI